jgi:hypothetical protein
VDTFACATPPGAGRCLCTSKIHAEPAGRPAATRGGLIDVAGKAKARTGRRLGEGEGGDRQPEAWGYGVKWSRTSQGP